MKKLIITSIILLIGLTSFSQLNENAKIVRDKLPGKYELIKKEAVKEWNNDNQMIVYTINNQCDCLFKIVENKYIETLNEDFIIEVFNKWFISDNGEDQVYDYCMIIYEIDLYLKNSDY